MQKVTKYVIFQTKWGYFGLAGTESALLRAHLPGLKYEKIESLLLRNLKDARLDKTFFKTLQKQINAYFEGVPVNFSPDIPVDLRAFRPFSRTVLTVCKDIRFGQTISYSQFAKKVGRGAAGRAVGSALAKNPIPLIIPCHRVIRSDSKIGGFSAPGGINLKKRLLIHEKQIQ